MKIGIAGRRHLALLVMEALDREHECKLIEIEAPPPMDNLSEIFSEAHRRQNDIPSWRNGGKRKKRKQI